MALRYCGSCGKKISKTKKPCPDCSIKIDKFKKPYKRLTFELKIILAIAISIVVGIEIIIIQFYLFFWSNEVSIPILGTLIFAPVYGILYPVLRNIRRLKKRGFKRCNKCKKKVAVNALFCIYCGKKIKWSINRVLDMDEEDVPRTIREITITEGSKRAVKENVHQWIDDNEMVVIVNKSDFIKGRIGATESRAVIAPKFFEISFKTIENGVKVHIEGYVLVKTIGKPTEWNFTPRRITTLGVPRKQGWKALMDLTNRLEKISNK